MHLYKFFFTRRYIAQTAIVKFCIGSPKTAQNEQVCAHQRSHEVNFTKSFFEQLYTGWIVVVHLYCGVSLCRQVAPQQSAKFRTAFFCGPFHTSLRKDSIANYASIWTLFSTSVTGRDILCNALNSSQMRL